MNTDQFNSRYPIGTAVFAYPGCRPEDGTGTRLVTRTRTGAQLSASGHPVVWVEGEGSYISLTHVDPVAEDVWEAAREAEASQPPEPTGRPKTAREKVAGLLCWSVPSGTDEEAKARTNQLLDELTSEVRTAAFEEAAAFFDGLADVEKDQHGYRARVMRGAANDVRGLNDREAS
ncbi:hypothetical protein [Streptomyces anthocyanicus]|uniref:hypothetical protein n=1 Tax=Streptomyces anthocyanicus TaxID=68174 RepID=UPI00382A67AA